MLFSILIKDKEIINKYNILSIASAVCIMDILKEIYIEDISIKWPNDVFIKGKKVAGILLESISFENNIEALILGVGINVNADSFDNEMLHVPTSIYLETENKKNIEDLRNKFFQRFGEMIKNVKENPTSLIDISKKYNIDNLIIVGLANDEIGYIIPPSDFIVDDEYPYVVDTKDSKGENHYEETMSVGETCADRIAIAFEKCLEKIK